MKSFLSNLGDVLQQTAFRKYRAARARFQKADPNLESPREVFAAACKIIASSLEPDGYTYAQSRASLTKRTADLAFEIHFQSDRNNVAGEHVGLWIHANVHSKRLAEWRASQPTSLTKHSGLAGGQIGNLLPVKGWMEWELADPTLRTKTIADAAETIRTVALPYFAQFEELARSPKRLVRTVPAELRISDAIEFALCYGTREDAECVLKSFFTANRDLLAAYNNAIAEFETNGLPRFSQANHARAAAYATLAYGLKAYRETGT